MNLCDSNVWVALTISDHPFHAAALRWFESVQEAGAVLFCRATQQSFLRLLTSAAVLALYGNAPLTNREAWRLYEALLADDRIVIPPTRTPGTGALLGAMGAPRYSLAKALDGCLSRRIRARRGVSPHHNRSSVHAIRRPRSGSLDEFEGRSSRFVSENLPALRDSPRRPMSRSSWLITHPFGSETCNSEQETARSPEIPEHRKERAQIGSAPALP